jgi:hypothetical protein
VLKQPLVIIFNPESTDFCCNNKPAGNAEKGRSKAAIPVQGYAKNF